MGLTFRGWATIGWACLSLFACGRTSKHEPAVEGSSTSASSGGIGGGGNTTSTDADLTSTSPDSTGGGSGGGGGTVGSSGTQGAAGASAESCTTDPDPTEENEAITCCDGAVCRGGCYEGTCWCESAHVSSGCEVGFFCCPVQGMACLPLGSACAGGPK